MLYVFFVWLSLPFFLLTLGELVLITYCLAWRKYTYGLVSLLVLAIALQLFSDIPVFTWMLTNKMTTLELFGGWLLVAGPYSLIRWWWYVINQNDKYTELVNEFLENHKEWAKNPGEFKPAQKIEFKRFLDDRKELSNAGYFEYYFDFYPKAISHKAEILAWMAFWPIDIVWTFLRDFIRKFFNRLFHLLLNQFNKISNYYWADKMNHLPTEQEIKLVREEKEEKEKQERTAWQNLQKDQKA